MDWSRVDVHSLVEKVAKILDPQATDNSLSSQLTASDPAKHGSHSLSYTLHLTYSTKRGQKITYDLFGKYTDSRELFSQVASVVDNEYARVRIERALKSYLNEVRFLNFLLHGTPQTSDVLPKVIDVTDPDEITTEHPSYVSILEYYDPKRFSHKLVLNEMDVKRCCKALSQMHAIDFSAEVDHGEESLWHRSTYWSLDKRRMECENLATEWTDFVNRNSENLSEVSTKTELLSLGQWVYANAGAWDAEINERIVSGPKWRTSGHVHGDFKTANLLWGTAAGDDASLPRIIDFQWTGRGLVAQDLMHMMFTSAEVDLLEEDGLDIALTEYMRSTLESSCIDDQSLGQLRNDFQLVFLDYFRYLISSNAWRGLTPAVTGSNTNKINLGIHKRSWAHLRRTIQYACTLWRCRTTHANLRNTEAPLNSHGEDWKR
eukprot:Clim_evm42s204 gene=Clim_evmTU42s204